MQEQQQGICVVYNGTICQKYLGSRRIFLNITFQRPQELHENITKGEQKAFPVDNFCCETFFEYFVTPKMLLTFVFWEIKLFFCL